MISPLANGYLKKRSECHEGDAKCIHIGLINNMPGAALEATERQFCRLLGAAADGIEVRVSLFALPRVPRSSEASIHIDRCYSKFNSLWSSHLDGLIVTGAEPLAPGLKNEPYWKDLSAVLQWAERNTSSSIWSCLAAHAAVLQIDGIERCPLREKHFGIFEYRKVSDNPLTARLTGGVAERVRMPHSRWNDLPGNALKACGYQVLTQSKDAGIDAFVKQRKSLFVFFQGHPEYDADSLLLEYRRDIRRFLRRERDCYPSMPHGLIDAETARRFTAVRERALSDRREDVLGEFPATFLSAKLQNIWRPAAVNLYRNWLRYLCERKGARRFGPRQWHSRSPIQPEYQTIGIGGSPL
jgi:homoserine O-succinyltransferase